MHRLLTRQLRRCFPAGAPPNLAELLAAVDDAYAQADADRALLERSLDLTSQELLQRGASLMEELAERKRREAELERQSAAIVATTEGIGLVDESGLFVYANPAHFALYGYQPHELIGQPWTILHEPQEVERLAGVVDTDLAVRGTWVGETSGRRANGERCDQEISLTRHAGGLIRVVRSIGERKRLERSLREAQKMDAIGRLAGGIAHDFNNVLTVIVGCADLVLEELAEDSPVRSDIGEIRGASNRASTITARLLALARRQVVEPRVLVLDDVVVDLSNLLRRTIGEHILLQVAPKAPGLRVFADAGQIEQVLLNLVINARDAMTGGGTITIRTEPGTAPSPLLEALPHGAYVLVTVGDTGAGMDETVKAHLFEPFFTTKGEGRGTGLGLATCYGIVGQLGGRIWADSRLGEGTTFSFCIPRAPEGSRAATQSSQRPLPRGKERILLVEDDPQVRDVASRSLKARGYAVTSCASGDQALQELKATKFDLVITDVVMPGMSGPDLVERLRLGRSEELPRILFITGYMEHLAAGPDIHVLAKPFTPASLTKVVRRLLDGS